MSSIILSMWEHAFVAWPRRSAHRSQTYAATFVSGCRLHLLKSIRAVRLSKSRVLLRTVNIENRVRATGERESAQVRFLARVTGTRPNVDAKRLAEIIPVARTSSSDQVQGLRASDWSRWPRCDRKHAQRSLLWTRASWLDSSDQPCDCDSHDLD